MTKNAGTMVMQELAARVSPDKTQIISFHPGVVYTDMVQGAGYGADTIPYDDRKPCQIHEQ